MREKGKKEAVLVHMPHEMSDGEEGNANMYSLHRENARSRNLETELDQRVENKIEEENCRAWGGLCSGARKVFHLKFGCNGTL